MASSSSSLPLLSATDFGFLEASGQTLCVPAQPRGFEWTGKAVKGLSGSGSVYVRLRTDVGDVDPWGKDVSPKSGSKDHTDVAIVKMEQPLSASKSTAAVSLASSISVSVVITQPPSVAMTPQSSVLTIHSPSVISDSVVYHSATRCRNFSTYHSCAFSDI